jgi:hypothetical protein
MPKRPSIPKKLKLKVLEEAGYRCAVPTCRQTTMEIAHIIPWAESREHKFENLIVLCPNCHTRFDKGEIHRESIIAYKRALSSVRIVNGVNNADQPNATCWGQYEKKKFIASIINLSDHGLFDCMLYIDKLEKTPEEIALTKHTMEILFGTVPPKGTLSHTVDPAMVDSRWGFPLVTAEFTDIKKQHWFLDHNGALTKIEHRSPMC